MKEMAKKEQGMIVKIVDPATSPEALLRPQKERPCVAVAEQPSADALQFDDVICDACRDGDSVDGNQIVLCDGCDVAIHQRCYGIGEVPEGDWFCERCIAKKAKDPVSSGFCVEGALLISVIVFVPPVFMLTMWSRKRCYAPVEGRGVGTRWVRFANERCLC